MPIRTLADVRELEQVPIWERITECSVYDRLLRTANRRSDHVALRSLMAADPNLPPRDVSYREFIRSVTQAANLLVSLGVGPKSVVSLLVPQAVESYFALFGAMAVGIANPLNFLLESEHLIAIMRQAGTQVLIAGSEALSPASWAKVAAIRSACPELKAVLRLGGDGNPPPGVLDFESALTAQPAERITSCPASSRDKVVALFHTGGTTGKPKLACHTNGGLLVAAWANGQVVSDAPEEVFLTGMPLFHVSGALIMGLTPLASGQTIVIPTPMGMRNPAVLRHYWPLVQRLEVTQICAVPTTMAALLNLPPEGSEAPGSHSRARFCLSGGAAVPVEIANRFTARYGLPVLEGYGMTEVHGYATMNPYAGAWRYGSVGLRMPYLELAVADVSPDGVMVRRCGQDEIGHVLMRGPQVFAGYLDPQNNERTFLADGWMDSGDLGRLDADGYLWLTGRAKDLIIRGGHNIDPALIEQALGRHPAVALAAAVGCPDRYAGELPVVFVQASPEQSPSPSDLLAFCRQHIPERAAVPVEVFLIAAIPLTAVGKIDKPALRKEAARRVFSRELATLSEDGVSAHVEIVDHPRHGSLARILVAQRGGLEAAALEHRCRQLFGGYQLRHEVVCLESIEPSRVSW